MQKNKILGNCYDLHVHSYYSCKHSFESWSNGVSTPNELVRFAKKIGLKGFAVTDHNSTRNVLTTKKAAKETGVLVVGGCEVRSAEGIEVLAIGITELPKQRSLDEIIQEIHQSGGFAVKAHPMFSGLKSFFEPFTGASKFDAVELNSFLPKFSNKLLKENALRKGVKLVAGSDSHSCETVGSAVTIFNEEIKDEDSLIAALRKGSMETRQFGSYYNHRLLVHLKHIQISLYKTNQSRINP